MDINGLNLGSLLGILVSLSGGLLCCFYVAQPKLRREHDIGHGIIILFSGGILLFQGWRLSISLVFAYLLLLISWLIFALESLRMRQWVVLQQRSDPRSPD
jgi:hypothetical protein